MERGRAPRLAPCGNAPVDLRRRHGAGAPARMVLCDDLWRCMCPCSRHRRQA